MSERDVKRDLEALRKLTGYEARMDPVSLYVDIPSGRVRVEDLTKEELVEVAYLLRREKESATDAHKRTLDILGEFSPVKIGS